MTDERPQDIVARGYDAGADAFERWQNRITDWRRPERVAELLALLPERPDVLELGSGAGVRSTQVLAERATLTGVDVSVEQIRRARKRVPTARFLCADFTTVVLEPASFDAVVSFYVFNHIPREELCPCSAGSPGGSAPTATCSRPSASDLPGWYGKAIGGLETFFSGYEPDVTLRLVRQVGLTVVRDELETIREPEGDATFLWVLARKPGSRRGRPAGVVP